MASKILERSDPHVAKLHKTSSMLQCDRSAGVSIVLRVGGRNAVKDDG